MFAALLSGEETVPAGAPAPRPSRRRPRPSAAAARAVAAVVPTLPGSDILRDRGASDADLAAIVRALARRGKAEEGCRLLFDRRMAVVEYGGRKRIKGLALTAAVRSLHGIPQPEEATPTPKPNIGRISAPERLPISRWGYRTDGTWWASTISTDRDGENGFNRVRNPVTIGKLDTWARTRFAHLHAATAQDEAAPSIPDQFRSLVAGASVQGDLLAHLGDEDPAEPAADSPRNYRITRAEGIGQGSPRRKAAANLAAIRLLATLDAEARHPTPAEQAVLARYSGWGALPNVFRDDAVEWDAERTELRALLTQAELASAEASTPNAHFTSLPVHHVDDVVDGLLVCLDRHARVDLTVIGSLWGGRSPAEVQAALAGRIYRDPHTGCWETADSYLAGPVRAKLEAARAAAELDTHYLANVAALEAVQPVDLVPSQIDCALGASWIPTDVVARFLRELLGKVAETATIDVVHFAREALWRVKAPKTVRESIEATRTWGTDRADAVDLLENALNQRETRIYDYPTINGQKVRVLNVLATVDAQDKQATIDAAFKAWVWGDGARAKHLLSIYNTVFNGTRLQTFDGSHLRFPGASSAIVLDPHQVNGVWRILSTGNTLVAHCVGAGKTYLAAAAGMKLRQVGLARKVLHVVMNHMLEQYSRETLQLYPNARLLVAGSDDLSGDGRRLFLSRVAEGDFDALVITHGAFGKLPMSRQFQEDFLQQEIDSYRALLDSCDAEDRPSIKVIQTALKQMEARLHALIARKNKDEFLTFEELGVDCVFIDEIQQFKNLDTPTKIVGIPRATQPSQRATDLLMKAIYIDRIRPGRGFVGMTGTPISNTIAEMHVMARLHARRLLTGRGIDHFDAFAGTFIKRVCAAELAPDGRTYRVRTRFHFENVAELTMMFRSFADVQVMRSYYEGPEGQGFEGATLELPIPKLAGGMPEVIAAEPSPAQTRFIGTLVKRADAIYKGQVNPKVDNMLAVVGDGRRAALDMRLIHPNAADWPGSKVNLCAAEVHHTWAETADRRLTQLVFVDISRPRTDGRFSVSNELRRKLIALGIPEGEIAFAQDATSDARKAALFKAVRAGRIRVLIGSTETMGMGTNVQRLLYRVHHLDWPWRSTDIEQRDGRMMRRGNLNLVCRITRYVTKGSLDAWGWNHLHYKLVMINRVMLGDLTIRRISDGDAAELSYAQLKAIASGNPLVLEKAAVDQRVLVLSRARSAFEDAVIRNRIDRVEIPNKIAAHQETEAALIADLAARRDTHADLFTSELAVPGSYDGLVPFERFVRRPEAAARLRQVLLEFAASSQVSATIGTFAGFGVTVRRCLLEWEVELALRGNLAYVARIKLNDSTPTGNLQVLENLPRRIESVMDSTRERIEYLQQQLETLANEAAEFPGEAEYQQLLIRQREIDSALRPGAEAEQARLRVAASDDDDDPQVAAAA